MAMAPWTGGLAQTTASVFDMTPSTVAHLLVGFFRVTCDVLFQKLFNIGVPELRHIGGPVEGLVAVVTGPTSGIGRVTAIELGRRGATGLLLLGQPLFTWDTWRGTLGVAVSTVA